jgi:leader peptidase (prepilin peptidase)/N-methyltransferase
MPPGAMGWVLPHFEAVTSLQIAVFAVAGLVIGSFLNVVIYRLPRMILAHELPDLPNQAPAFNLNTPSSHCPHCQYRLAWFELVPVLSYLGALGHCRHCQHRIAWRYPFVELLTSVLFSLCLFKFGLGLPAVLACFFSAILLALAWTDAETFLLPDALTQALLWVGLVASAMSLSLTPLVESLAGAVFGYGILWVVSWLFQALTGKEGMGQGDLKLLAGLGAWVGIWSLLPLILLASVSGLIFGVIQKMRGQLGDNGHFAFGPFLAISGFACFFLGISMGV